MQEQIERIAQQAARICGYDEATEEILARTQAVVKNMVAYLRREELPQELEGAAAEYIADGAGVKSIKEGNVSISYGESSGLPLKELLSGYRRLI